MCISCSNPAHKLNPIVPEYLPPSKLCKTSDNMTLWTDNIAEGMKHLKPSFSIKITPHIRSPAHCWSEVLNETSMSMNDPWIQGVIVIVLLSNHQVQHFITIYWMYQNMITAMTWWLHNMFCLLLMLSKWRSKFDIRFTQFLLFVW